GRAGNLEHIRPVRPGGQIVGHVDIRIGDVQVGGAGNQTVHPGIKNEGIVGTRRKGDFHPNTSLMTAPASARRSNAASIFQAPRFRGPTGLETARISRKGIPMFWAATATPKPSIASAAAPGTRIARAFAVSAVPVAQDTVSTGPTTDRKSTRLHSS